MKTAKNNRREAVLENIESVLTNEWKQAGCLAQEMLRFLRKNQSLSAKGLGLIIFPLIQQGIIEKKSFKDGYSRIMCYRLAENGDEESKESED